MHNNYTEAFNSRQKALEGYYGYSIGGGEVSLYYHLINTERDLMHSGNQLPACIESLLLLLTDHGSDPGLCKSFSLTHVVLGALKLSYITVVCLCSDTTKQCSH